MQKIKPILSLLLTVIILLGAYPVNAADALPFQDVSEGDWYSPAVRYCFENGLMMGVSDSEFAPGDTVTREMLAQVVYRIAGGTAVEYTERFDDVKPDEWYTDAILWDAAQGLTNGAGATSFGIGEQTTREQVVTFFFRYDAPESWEKSDLSCFADSSAVSDWAVDAVNWAVASGILVGSRSGDAAFLAPNASCTRAEFAQILRRYLDGSQRETGELPDPDPTPGISKYAVTFNGIQPPHTYGTPANAKSALVRLSDLTACFPALRAETTVTDDGAAYQCRIRCGNLELGYLSGNETAVYDGTDWYIPVGALPEKLGYTPYYDEAEAHLYYTPLPDVNKIPAGINVPVLMYHAVSDNIWSEIDELFVSPANMEAQLKYLVNNGYTPIFFEDLPNAASYRKPVILTFDDGYRDNYTELFPLLKKYHVKATIFVIPDNVGKPVFMTWEQIREMSDSGLVSIQSHTMTHPDLDTLSAEKNEWELAQSQLIITRKTGKQPCVICYPTGLYNNATITSAQKHYLFGLLMKGSTDYRTGANRYTIPRYYVSRYTSLSSFINMVS